jgi:hypothetical protein
MPDKAAIIRDWLKALATLCASNLEPDDLRGKLRAYVPMLSQEFPQEAFSPAALAHVARAGAFFPSFAELCNALAPWWKEHRPQPIAITSDQPDTVRNREIERLARESWRNITPEQIRAKIRALNGNPMRDVLGHFLATALANHAPHHLGLLPPQWLDVVTEPAEVTVLRRPAAFTITSEVKRAKANDEDWRQPDVLSPDA